MIKVLNVVVDNHIGGIQNRILSVGKELKNRGIETIILSPKGDGDFSNIARDSGFVVHQAMIGSPKLLTSFKNILRNAFWIIQFPLGVIGMIGVIKRESIDIVHVNGLLSLHAVFAAKITNTPLVWHLIGTIYPKMLVRIIRPLFLWSQKIVLVTNKTREYYLNDNIANDLVRIIFEPVDINYFQKLEELNKANLRSKYNINHDSCVVGFIGNISPVKGLEYLLKVAKQQKGHSDKQILFVIAGRIAKNQTSYAAKLHSMVDALQLNDDVKFIENFVDVREIYSIIDIFLMTSISEGTPLVILEAMAMEIPIIAPNVGGITEQIMDGETGFVVPPRDIEATLTSLRKLINDSVLRETMGRKGRERARSLFSLDRCVNLHQNLFLEMK